VEFQVGRIRNKGENVGGMSITTKKGDGGFSELLFGERVSKTSAQIEALGVVDELNAVIGLARLTLAKEGQNMLDQIQGWLITLMGELAMPCGREKDFEKAGFGRIGQEQISFLENWSQQLEDPRSPQGWLRPGKEGGESSARFHVARTVARRAERRIWSLPEQVATQEVRIFLNRLSDYLWLMAKTGTTPPV
jgi:cob(I)alamin adenosyltransferase